MTVVELVLDRMKHGATLIVIGDLQRDAVGDVTCSEIKQLILVTTSGARIPLPLAIFPEISPHLTEAVHEDDCTLVYALRDKGRWNS